MRRQRWDFDRNLAARVCSTAAPGLRVAAPAQRHVSGLRAVIYGIYDGDDIYAA